MTCTILGYNLAMVLGICLLWPIWVPLVWFRKKHRYTFFKRLSMESLRRNDAEPADAGRRIWIHALSVGEVLSAEPLVEALADRHGARHLVFTTSTLTGFEVASRLIAPHVLAVRHFPYDTRFSVNRALKAIKPRRVVIVETDIWPNFLHRLSQCGIPVYLVNARLSDRSFNGYRRIAFLTSPLLSVFDRICVQTDSDRLRFRALGVPEYKLLNTGNLKFDQAPASLSTGELDQFSEIFNIRAGAPVWVAGSTHDGEEDIISKAYRKVRASGIAPLLIVAPRDPGRAAAVCRIFLRTGCPAMTLTQAEKKHGSSAVAVVVIDRIGMLRKLYALADVTFVGGSLVKAGGHNPLEPASVGKPILFGPHTDDFRLIYRNLEAAGAAIRVGDADQLAEKVGQLMLNKEESGRVGRCAYGVFVQHRGAVERTLAVVENFAGRSDP